MEQYHIPVLVNEVLDGLNIQSDGIYLDVTFGGGGHTQKILETDPTVKVVGLDWDKNAIDRGEQLVEEFPGRLTLIWGSFAHLYKILKKHKVGPFNGILADFGTSQFQIHERDGFSFNTDTPLDMRMSTAHYKTTAAHIINYAVEQELCEIFWKYGEERNTKEIVRLILQTRQKKKITTTKQLAQLILKVSGPRKGKIHPATRVFQALRIFVNKELDNIEAFLPTALKSLVPGGRFACISFHSLEDRIVKQYFKEQENNGIVKIISKKAIKASEKEREGNSSARSAKMRVIEKNYK